jgi:amino acid transporter
VSYLGHLAPSAAAGASGIWIGVSLIAACALWNMLGAKAVGGSSVLMGILLLAPFAVLTCLAFFHRAAQGAQGVPLRKVDILGGILVAMWNYMGWDNISTVADEVERPQRTYPIGMAATVLLVAVTYILPIAAVAINGLDANRWDTGGWASVARAVLSSGAGDMLALAITAAGMVGAAGSLNALTMSLARLPAVMAEDGYLPAIVAKRHPKTGAPWVAILACAFVWALCLQMSFVKLIVLDVLLTGLSILLEFAALVALRIREPDLFRPYRVPGGLAGAVSLGVLPLVLLVLTVIRNDAERVGPINALQLGGILIALGVAAYFLRRSPARSSQGAK